MKYIFILFIMFNIFIYTPAIVNWYSELYLIDILFFIIGSIYLLIKILLPNLRILKVILFISIIFLYFSFSYSASGNFLNPLYGIKQLNLLFAFIIFFNLLKKVNLHKLDRLFKNFLIFLILFYLLLYISGYGMGFMPNSLLPRLYLSNIKLDFVELIGSSAILTGTFFVVTYIYFLSHTNIKNRHLFIILSIVLVIFSGTRAALLELIFGTLFFAKLQGNFKKIFFRLIFVLIIISPFIIAIFYKRIFDHSSNSVHLLLWNMAIAMFLQNPLTGLGANTFHKLKNEYVDYSLPESYGVHSTLFKFIGEGGILLFIFYIILWYLVVYFYKKRKYIVNDLRNFYYFALTAYFVLLFHSIFDNYFMAKLNEYFYIFLLSLMSIIYMNSKKMKIAIIKK